jgi:ferric-dicitrate binding protein FerR (iron transport regulator)
MISHTSQEPDTEYTQAVETERAAWHELQSQPVGSARRAQAWSRWSEAISLTNAAWRRLNSVQRPIDRAAGHAQPHGPAC